MLVVSCGQAYSIDVDDLETVWHGGFCACECMKDGGGLEMPHYWFDVGGIVVVADGYSEFWGIHDGAPSVWFSLVG